MIDLASITDAKAFEDVLDTLIDYATAALSDEKIVSTLRKVADIYEEEAG